MEPPPKTRYVVREFRSNRTVYHGWDDDAAARALLPGTVCGSGPTFMEAEAAATYQICLQWQRLGITGTNTEVSR